MRIPFYQTEWHGIDLVDLANQINHPIQKTAAASFYEAFYRKLLSKKQLAEGWKNSKSDASIWLANQIDKFGLSNRKILSIGAGTGIIEAPLIDKGLKIDLHDVQENSFEITGINKKTTCFVGELSDIPKKYDALVTIAACYTLSSDQMESFFLNCANLLKKDGTLIILDTSLSWHEIYSYLRNRSYYQENCLLWGQKRSINNISSYSKKFFSLKEFSFYNDEMKPLDVIKFMNIPINVTPVWQSLVFMK